MNFYHHFFLAIFLLATYACDSPENKSSDLQQADSPTIVADSVYLQKGKQIAAATFAVLSSQLQKSLKSGGVREAVSYCNIAALPLTDSLSKIHQATIRRTSLKVRNPADAATEDEISVLRSYQDLANSNQPMKPRVKKLNEGKVQFYAPITINALCLQCHGKVDQDIKNEDYHLIRTLYPDDQAIDYADGDFRGIWSITMDR